MRSFINIVEGILSESEESQARHQRAAAMGFDTTQVWYHGSKTAFAEFSKEFVGLGTDQNGSGFYFTSDPEDAEYYSGREGSIMNVFLRLRKEVSRNKPLPRKALLAIIGEADEDHLWDFGDVGREGKDAVIRSAVGTYANLDAFNAMICLSNDFFRREEGKFIEVFSKATGCNHITDSRGPAQHCVMLDPRDIRSVHAAFLKDGSADLLA